MDTKIGDCVEADYLIIGSGIAGLRAALELGKRGHVVALVTKRKLCDGNTFYAQGGIAAVPLVDGKPLQGDSLDSHIKDTLEAGKGISDRRVVESFAGHAYRDVIEPLLHLGVGFTKAKKTAYSYSLHQEGGHSSPRIFHVADYTGRAVEEALIAAVRQLKNVRVYEHHMAINLITKSRIVSSGKDACLGAYVYDTVNDTVHAFSAKATFLATGGAGRAYLFTTNAVVETGDGIAMANRAGLPIANMEFFQFHPTVIYGYDKEGQSFLLTEALRGRNVGGILTLSKDSTDDFVRAYDKRGSSATRDVVAQAIDAEMKKRGLDHVWLNVTSSVTGKSPEEIREGFPDIYAKCKEVLGIDIAQQPIPTVPAAHYTIGGVLVGMYGETELPGLYAIGEVSCTGLHGANRLASNSLPEAALFGKLAVQHALNSSYSSPGALPAWEIGNAVKSSDEVRVAHNWDEVRRIMWHLVGIVRTGDRLEMAKRRLELIKKETFDYYWNYHISRDLLELRNIADVASLIVDSALSRKESRGGHFRQDYPHEDKAYARPSVLKT